MPNVRVYVAILMSLSLPPALASADVMDSARMVPSDTFVLVSIESVEGLKSSSKKTCLYELYNEPALQEVVGPAEKKIREKIDEALKGLWKEIRLETPPKEIPWPQGRVIVAVFLAAREMPLDPELPDADASAGAQSPETDRPALPKTERVPDFQVVVLADMGKNLDAAKALAQDLARSAGDAGQTRKRQRIRGIEFEVLGKDEQKDGNDLVCFGFKDNWLVAGSSLKRIEAVVKHLDREAGNPLAGHKGFQTMARTVGAGDIFLFLNAEPARQLLKDLPARDKARIDRVIQVLGLDTIQGVAASWQIAPNRQENARLKALVGLTSPKRGVPALLCPASAPVQSNLRGLGQDTIFFVAANYDLAKLYDRIAGLVMETSAVDINFFAQTAMAATSQTAGQPPVSLRNDVLACASAPQIFSWRMDKPFTVSSNSKTLGTIAVRDSDKLDTALARIHQAYIAKSDTSLQRKMLEYTLFLLPPMSMSSPFLSPMGQGQIEERQFAFAVAGGNLAFGESDVVEQVIRDSRKETLDTLSSDPLFRYVKRYLPAEAGVYWYQNTQRYWEVCWTMLRQQARGIGHPPRDSFRYDDGGIHDRLKVLQEVVDLTKLPEYDRIRKHLGASVGHMKEHAEGIYFESVDLRPPE